MLSNVHVHIFFTRSVFDTAGPVNKRLSMWDMRFYTVLLVKIQISCNTTQWLRRSEC